LDTPSDHLDAVTSHHRAGSFSVDTSRVLVEERLKVGVLGEARLKRPVVHQLSLELGVISSAQRLEGFGSVFRVPVGAAVAFSGVARGGSSGTVKIIRTTSSGELGGVGGSAVTVVNPPVPGDVGVTSVATLVLGAIKRGFGRHDGSR